MTVTDIFTLWPSVSDLARDLGLKRESHGTLMKHRGSIPVGYWPRLLDAAARRGIQGLSYDVLVAAHAGAPPLANDDMAAASDVKAEGEHNLGCNNHKRAVNF